MKKFKDNGDGQAIVEFALIMPIFILILIGIIEFGNIWMTMNILTGASREGARIAAVTAPDVERVTNAVSNVISSIGISEHEVTVQGPDMDSRVVVSVGITYTMITRGIIPGMAGTIGLVRRTTMHWEG